MHMSLFFPSFVAKANTRTTPFVGIIRRVPLSVPRHGVISLCFPSQMQPLLAPQTLG